MLNKHDLANVKATSVTKTLNLGHKKNKQSKGIEGVKMLWLMVFAIAKADIEKAKDA